MSSDEDFFLFFKPFPASSTSSFVIEISFFILLPFDFCFFFSIETSSAFSDVVPAASTTSFCCTFLSSTSDSSLCFFFLSFDFLTGSLVMLNVVGCSFKSLSDGSDVSICFFFLDFFTASAGSLASPT
uniref:Uncharacterized protein n=1 Tax=Opuntia streptacantha TaxID=393608 RepID=A0A7C8ZK79_OPUST